MRPVKAPSKCSPRVGRWNSLSTTYGSTRLPRVPQKVRPLPRRGYPGKWSTRSNRMRQLGFRSGGAANPRTSRPGSSTSPTLPPLGSPVRFSPSTVALNSPDPQRFRQDRVTSRHADPHPDVEQMKLIDVMSALSDPVRVGLVRLLSDGAARLS